MTLFPSLSDAEWELESKKIGDTLEVKETEATWENLNEAISKLDRLVQKGAFNFPSFLPFMKKCRTFIVNCLLTERTRLSGTCVGFLTAIASLDDNVILKSPNNCSEFHNLLSDWIIPALLKLATRSNKIMSARAHKCLLTMMQNRALKGYKWIPKICESFKSATANKFSRSVCVEILSIAFDGNKNGSGFSHSELSSATSAVTPSESPAICQVIVSGLNDPATEVRELARKLYNSYSSLFESEAESFIRPKLGANVQKYLMISTASSKSSSNGSSSHTQSASNSSSRKPFAERQNLSQASNSAITTSPVVQRLGVLHSESLAKKGIASLLFSSRKKESNSSESTSMILNNSQPPLTGRSENEISPETSDDKPLVFESEEVVSKPVASVKKPAATALKSLLSKPSSTSMQKGFSSSAPTRTNPTTSSQRPVLSGLKKTPVVLSSSATKENSKPVEPISNRPRPLVRGLVGGKAQRVSVNAPDSDDESSIASVSSSTYASSSALQTKRKVSVNSNNAQASNSAAPFSRVDNSRKPFKKLRQISSASPVKAESKIHTSPQRKVEDSDSLSKSDLESQQWSDRCKFFEILTKKVQSQTLNHSTIPILTSFFVKGFKDSHFKVVYHSLQSALESIKVGHLQEKDVDALLPLIFGIKTNSSFKSKVILLSLCDDVFHSMKEMMIDAPVKWIEHLCNSLLHAEYTHNPRCRGYIMETIGVDVVALFKHPRSNQSDRTESEEYCKLVLNRLLTPLLSSTSHSHMIYDDDLGVKAPFKKLLSVLVEDPNIVELLSYHLHDNEIVQKINEITGSDVFSSIPPVESAFSPKRTKAFSSPFTSPEKKIEIVEALEEQEAGEIVVTAAELVVSSNTASDESATSISDPEEDVETEVVEPAESSENLVEEIPDAIITEAESKHTEPVTELEETVVAEIPTEMSEEQTEAIPASSEEQVIVEENIVVPEELVPEVVTETVAEVIEEAASEAVIEEGINDLVISDVPRESVEESISGTSVDAKVEEVALAEESDKMIVSDSVISLEAPVSEAIVGEEVEKQVENLNIDSLNISSKTECEVEENSIEAPIVSSDSAIFHENEEAIEADLNTFETHSQPVPELKSSNFVENEEEDELEEGEIRESEEKVEHCQEFQVDDDDELEEGEIREDPIKTPITNELPQENEPLFPGVAEEASLIVYIDDEEEDVVERTLTKEVDQEKLIDEISSHLVDEAISYASAQLQHEIIESTVKKSLEEMIEAVIVESTQQENDLEENNDNESNLEGDTSLLLTDEKINIFEDLKESAKTDPYDEMANNDLTELLSNLKCTVLEEEEPERKKPSYNDMNESLLLIDGDDADESDDILTDLTQQLSEAKVSAEAKEEATDLEDLMIPSISISPAGSESLELNQELEALNALTRKVKTTSNEIVSQIIHEEEAESNVENDENLKPLENSINVQRQYKDIPSIPSNITFATHNDSEPEQIAHNLIDSIIKELV